VRTSSTGNSDANGESVTIASIARCANVRQGAINSATRSPRPGDVAAPAIICASTVTYPSSRSSRKISVATATHSAGVVAPATAAE